MTDARLRGEWLTAPAHDGLSDAAYRVFHNALMHSNEQGTDGAIATRELRFLYPAAIKLEVLAEIEAAGFWERTESGYQLLGWSTTLGQSTAEAVEENRRRARERMQRVRDQRRTTQGALDEFESPRSEVVLRNVRPNNTANPTRNVGQDRTGPEGGLPAYSRSRAGASARAKSGPTLVDIRRDCAEGRHRLVSDGSCMHCEYRQEREAS